MRLFAGLAVAGLAGLVAGSVQQQADVYILKANPESSQATPPQIPRQVARHILAQRVGTDAITSDFPDTIDEDTALSYILKYGKKPAALFQQKGADAPAAGTYQLVMILEGSTRENVQPLLELPSMEPYKQPSYTILESKSAKDKKPLIGPEFGSAGVAKACKVAAAMYPLDESCWTGKGLVVKYDITKDSDAYSALRDELPYLVKLVKLGYVEATLVFLPPGSRAANVNVWAAGSDLRRRAFDESVIVEDPELPATSNKQSSTQGGNALPFIADTKASIPACFQSYNSCATVTGNCSGHGMCEDKYAIPGQGSGKVVCFHCRCEATFKNPDRLNSSRIHWGGAMCQKEDVSSSFWLLTLVSVVLIGTVTFCIGLLFSVGEEKLPGVIGAGVSRSK